MAGLKTRRTNARPKAFLDSIEDDARREGDWFLHGARPGEGEVTAA